MKKPAYLRNVTYFLISESNGCEVKLYTVLEFAAVVRKYEHNPKNKYTILFKLYKEAEDFSCVEVTDKHSRQIIDYYCTYRYDVTITETNGDYTATYKDISLDKDRVIQVPDKYLKEIVEQIDHL